MTERDTHLWWQRGIVYQVYPRSFADADGDGVGDLRGITAKLDHLRWLGVDALWLSPIFPSPMADFGYDVSDYTDIHPLFGTLDDFDALVREAHARDLKVLLDWVPNHTSDEHPWFVASRASRDNPKRDWYVWRDPAPDGGPPTNWLSLFGGGAWEWDEPTGQYYLHLFHKKQPDLNWRNPAVQAAMLDTLRFWLDRGVDGFRIDVLWLLIKDDQFRDNPPNPDWQPGDRAVARQIPLYTQDRPEVHEIVRMVRRVLDDYDERVMIGEIYLPLDRLVAYYGIDGAGAHLPFNFHLVTAPWHARGIASYVDAYEAALPPGGWPNWVLGNHDRSRIATRVGPAQARVAAILLLTLRGTPTIYYGDEIGMHDVPIPPELAQDPVAYSEPGHGRDPERTPMQWDATTTAGFTTGTPWLPIAEDHATINVAAQRDDASSLLTLHRDLIALRRREPALSVGSYYPITAEGDLLAYIRRAGPTNRRFLIVLNLGSDPALLTPQTGMMPGRVVLSTHRDRDGEEINDGISLRGNEGAIVQLSPEAAG